MGDGVHLSRSPVLPAPRHKKENINHTIIVSFFKENIFYDYFKYPECFEDWSFEKALQLRFHCARPSPRSGARTLPERAPWTRLK